MAHLLEGFQEHFQVVEADKQELIEQSFALRYQVYCIEKAFEAPACFENGQESDPYDARSVHSLVYHRRLGRYIGSVRLVLADRQAPEAPFPIENLCSELHRARLFLSDNEPRFRVAEISRFVISKLRRCSGQETADRTLIANQPCSTVQGSTPENGILPYATLGLFTAIVRMSASHGITHWYALMEPILSRLLDRFGIYFQPVGPLVQHRGGRQPLMGEIDRVLAGIFVARPDVWELITNAGRTWPLNESLAAWMQTARCPGRVSRQQAADSQPAFRPAEGLPAYRLKNTPDKRARARALFQ